MMKKLTLLLLSIIFSLSVINSKSAFGELESTKGSKIDGIEYEYQQNKKLNQKALLQVKADSLRKAANKKKEAGNTLKNTNEVVTKVESVSKASTEIGAEVEKFQKGRKKDLTKVKKGNKNMGKANDAIGNTATIVNTGQKVKKAYDEGGKMVKDFKEANEDIAKARKFWNNYESKQKDVKAQIESAGGYYQYIVKQGGNLSLEEQRAIKLKLEKFVNKKRPKLDDAEMLSMDNIDVRGTVSELANSTSGNMQIIFKTIDNSIKAVDELNGLRDALKDRDANAKLKDETIARTRAKQKEIKDKVANEYGGSWDAYIKARYPTASDEKRKEAASRIKAAAHREIKDVNTDVGFWESIDVGGSIDALASNITMLGNKTLDAAAGLYGYGKNIYQGSIDGFALLTDADGVAEAEETKKQTEWRLRAMKVSKDWDVEKLSGAINTINDRLKEIKEGVVLGEGQLTIEQLKMRQMVYKWRYAQKLQAERIAFLIKTEAAANEAAAKEKTDAANKAAVAKKEKLAQEETAQKEVENEESAIDLKDRMDAVFTIMKSPLKVKVNKIKETATHYHGLIISSVFFKENELILNKVTGELSITYKLKGKRAPWLICKSATPVLGVYTGRIITNNKHAVDVGYFAFKFDD